jgi:exodeoxyribonuclease V alpha subunit
MLLPEPVPLRAIDRAVQRFVRERDPTASDLLLDAAGLASHQVGQGHACIDLAALPTVAPAARAPVERLQSVALERLQDHLLASPLVSGDQCISRPDALFVLDGSRFYLRRYWDCERAVITGIERRLALGLDAPGGLAASLDRLFPARGRDLDWQRIACAVAAASRFAVVTGGPGTGKTTTVVRMLGLLQTQAMQHDGVPLRIRLAAPTGKAAARLGEAIRRQLAELAVDAAVRDAIPGDVATVHRLLGRRRDSRRPRHDAGDPLGLDVLVVDEASMLDLEMMAALLAALPDESRLILLGDRDQLASVEAGSVFGDLCRRAAAAAYSAATRDWIAAASGARLEASGDDGNQLDQHIVMLRHSHRFGRDSGIGQLAAAANEGDIDALASVLGHGHRDLDWQPADEPPTALAVHGYRPYLECIAHTRPPASADAHAWLAWAATVVAAHGRFQLLAATREGRRGVAGLNAAIARALHAAGLIANGEDDQAWYEGRPVMVTRNDYASGLMNGDVGITLRMPAGDATALRVVFPAIGDTAMPVRVVSPARLSDVDTVYAMTVHKSQGSEFEHAALVLPSDDSAALTRELVYTAITRARTRFTLVASMETLALAVGRRTRRASGLSTAWPAEAPFSRVVTEPKDASVTRD